MTKKNKTYLGDDGFSMFGADFYPTPTEVIDRMLEFSDVVGKVILEPSAGKGNIVDYLNNAGAKEVIVCENESSLKSILSDKKCRFLKDNFLDVTAVEVSHVDMIVMNPPFSKQEDHFLHAWEIAPDGCEIVSLCNYNSELIDPYWSTNKKYKIISEVIEKYGNIEDFGHCFSNAERKTEVRVGCIKVYKPYKEKSKEFDNYFDLTDEEEKINFQEGLITYDFVKDTVNTYVEACKQFESVKDKNDSISKLIHKFSEYGDLGDLFKVKMTYETFKKELQKKAWRWVLAQFKMEKYLTEKAKAQINRFVEKQSNVPFSVKNIYKMVDIIIGTHSSRMDQTLIDAFDLISSYSSENTTAGEKWKTNSNYQINKKFIVPYIGSYSTMKEIDDIVKALCYLTGYEYPNKSFEWDFKRNYIYGSRGTGWKDWEPFFEVKLFLKGTGHFKFKDEKVREMFNRKVAELKGWSLPTESESTKKQKRNEQANETRRKNKGKEEEGNLPVKPEINQNDLGLKLKLAKAKIAIAKAKYLL